MKSTKLLLLFVATILTGGLMAQTPQKFSYQAVVKNASNNLVINHAVGLRVSILNASNTVMYCETQIPVTNANGLLSVQVGAGTVVSGSITGIDWSASTYSIKSEIDPAGGTSYSITGTSALLSVPYALHAKSVDNIYYNTGNVGIGTTTPSSKLHIAGADMNNALLFENTSANPGRNYILFKTQGTEQGYIGLGGGATNHMSVAAYGASNNLFLETNGTVKMTVLPSGNVGIGTTAPAAKLHVYGTQTGGNWAGMGAFGGASYAVVLGQYNDKAYLGAHNAALNAWADLAINAGGGNVGIGTTTPNNKLQIGPTSYSVNSLAMGNGTQNFAIDISARTIPTFFSDNNFSFMGSGGSGNVGIGTTTPYTTLTVGSTDATAKITAGGPNTHLTLASAGPAGDIYLNAGGVASGNYSTSTRLSVGANGNVGIGTTTPSSNLTVNGATTCQIQIQSAGVSKGYLWWDASNLKLGVGPGSSNNSFMFNPSTSTVNFNGASCNGTTWANASDSRLKRDIQPMSKYGLSTVMQLKPVTYFYKADKTNHLEVGFIAQEVQKIVPEVVSGTEGDITKGETLGLSYGNLVPVLTKAIQEQQASIETLKTTVQSQQAQIDELKTMLKQALQK